MVELSFSFKELEFFLLILTRVTAFVFIAPFFSMNNTPAMVKIGLGVFISYLLYQAMDPRQYVEYSTLLGYTAIVIKEAAVGLLIGFGAQICTYIANFAGNLVDMEMGLSMVNQLDPTTQQNSTISGVFYQYTIMLILLISGMYQYLLIALSETFILIPVGNAVFNSEDLLLSIIMFLTNFVVISFRISLPIFSVMLMLNSILGILAKVAPQMNMFAVGLQLKILVGLSAFLLTIVMLPSVANFIFEEMKNMIEAFVGGMM